MKLELDSTFIARSINEFSEERALIFDSEEEARAWRADDDTSPTKVETVANLYNDLTAHSQAIRETAQEWRNESKWIIIGVCLIGLNQIPEDSSFMSGIAALIAIVGVGFGLYRLQVRRIKSIVLKNLTISE
jgi:hypothetical protein